MLLNLILRCYIIEEDYKGASEFIKNTLFPENKINNEFIKYLYYTSKVKAVELDYKEAHSRVVQALRKAPENSVLGFRLQAEKLAIVVEMLMGSIPVRSTFVEGPIASYLYPYYELTKSLVRGEVKAYEDIVQKYKSVFQQDGLLILINRLTLNVIRAGLRRINLSYSRISFADISVKLGLHTSTDVESMVAKAIRDGVIGGSVDYSTRELLISENTDLYSTRDPQINFQKRIDYCTSMINTCNKAMLYQEANKKEENTDGIMDEEIAFEELLENLGDDEFM